MDYPNQEKISPSSIASDPLYNLSLFRPEARISSEVRLLGWNVPPDELQHIPDHWLSYPEPPAERHYLLAILYICFTAASLIGNGVVMWIFMSAKSLRTPSNIFVVHLAFCDFLMMSKTPVFIYNSFNRGFALGNLGCQIYSWLGAFSGIGANCSNLLIAYDRYNVITRPMEGKMSKTQALILIAIVWIYASPWATLPVLGIYGKFVPAWNVPPEELQYIPEHWLSYPEPEEYMHYMLALLYIGFMIASVIGNGLVIFIFISAKTLRTPSNIFVLNLAVCDFIMMCKTPIFIYNSFMKGFALGHIGCQIFALIGSFSGIASGMTNAVIGMDRYNVIARPMEGKLTYKKAIFIVILIWAYTIPWGLLPLFQVWGRFVPEGYLTSCTFDYLTDTFETKTFVAGIFTCSFIIPMTLIIMYYSQIVKHVFAHEKALREQAKKMNVESLRSNVDQNKQSTEIRIAKAAVTMCFLFVASWVPYGIMSMIGAFGNKALLTPGVTMIPACTCKMVACIDPYIYAISHPRYRLELSKRLPWLPINEKPESTGSVATETATTTA